MEKIFKKSLALMVSAALCLTAFVGCLTVNAEETATPTYKITAQDGKAGDTVTVNVDGTNLTSVCGQQVFINIPSDLTIVSVKDNAGKAYVNVADVAEGEAFDYSVVTTETTKQVRFADIINFDSLTTAEFHIVFKLTIPDTAAVGATYDIAFDTATMFADIDENAIGITVTPATITVQAAGPVEDSNIALSNSYVQIDANLNFVLMLNKTTVSQYSRHEVEFSRESFTSTYMFTTVSETQTSPAVTAGNNEYYRYTGIGMYELNMPVSVTVKCYDSDENYVAYKTFSFNMIDMLKNVYNASSTADTLKNTIADLINLATEAQKYFAKDTNDLYSVQLPTERFNPTSTTEFNVENLTNVSDVTSTVGATANLGLSLKKNPGTYYIVSGLSSYDSSKLSFEISYTNGLNGNVVSETVSGSETGNNLIFAGNRFYWIFDKIAFYDLDKTVTANVYYDGGTEPVLTINYTVETYISANYNSATQGSLLIALAKFSESARTHFIK